MKQESKLVFSPQTGVKLTDRSGMPQEYSAGYWRAEDDAKWTYNPWTGNPRTPRDIMHDAFGKGIVAPSDTEAGWLGHDGGPMPMDHGAEIEICYRRGATYHTKAGSLAADDWDHDGYSGDIVAYKVLGPQAESEGDDEYLLISDKTSEVLKTCSSEAEAKDLAKLIRRTGGEVSIYKCVG